MRFLFSIGACLVLLIGTAYFFYSLQPLSADRSTETDGAGAGPTREGMVLEFTISKGDGFREIGAKLSQKNLIRSLSVFKLYALLAGRAQRFLPGVYGLSSAMSVPDIVNVLTAGTRGDVLVTIPEGSSLRDIDGMLAASGITRKGALAALRPEIFMLEFPALAHLTSLEGVFFPDTYYFSVDTAPEAAARRMIENFMRKGMPLIEDEDDWYRALILASLLEREVTSFGDRQTVAGIFLKRLRLGMPLQIDATVSYAKCGGGYRECDRVAVARDDLGVSSPYNTYAVRGFPPTPIASPGVSALKAAAEPIASPYLYYLSARGTGETVFSRTLEEHNANRAKYL